MSTYIKDDWEVQAKKDIAASKAAIFDLIEHNDMLDEDGYPTNAALDVIRLWHWNDTKGWFKFIEGLWYMKDWGWVECEGGLDEHTNQRLNDKTTRFHISTAGWSGNEDIIRAMQSNSMMWQLNWIQSRRGGHYIFELKKFNDD